MNRRSTMLPVLLSRDQAAQIGPRGSMAKKEKTSRNKNKKQTKKKFLYERIVIISDQIPGISEHLEKIIGIWKTRQMEKEIINSRKDTLYKKKAMVIGSTVKIFV